jgi:hypothetical protein
MDDDDDVMRPDDDEIMEQADKASESTKNLSGMTYQEGVEAALRWVLGEFSDPPMED